MKDLSLREKIMIVILIIVLVSGAYYNFFLAGILETNSILDQRMETVDRALFEAKAKTSQLGDVKEEMESLEGDIDIYTSKLLPGMDRPYLLEMLELNVYPRVDDPVVSFNPIGEDLEHVNLHKIDITFQTDFDSFRRVLQNLKQVPVANRVINTSMRISNEDEGLFNLRISIEVLTDTKDMAEFKR